MTAKKGASVFLRGIELPYKLWYGSNFIVFFGDYDNFTLKLRQKKHSYPDEGWVFVGRFKG